MTTLPDGYTLYMPSLPDAPETASAEPRSTAPGYELYGGSTMNWAQDGRGVWYLGCNAEHGGAFLFRVFMLGSTGTLMEVPLSEAGSGRGWIDVSNFDGRMYYASWEGKQTRPVNGPGLVPGAAPIEGKVGKAAYEPLSPNRYSAAIDGQTVSGGRTLDIPTLYGLPVTCRAYAVRLVAQTAAPNVRTRLGLETQPGQLTVNAQVAGMQLHQVGIVNAGPGGSLWLSVVDGTGAAAQAQVWLTIIGYWP